MGQYAAAVCARFTKWHASLGLSLYKSCRSAFANLLRRKLLAGKCVRLAVDVFMLVSACVNT